MEFDVRGTTSWVERRFQHTGFQTLLDIARVLAEWLPRSEPIETLVERALSGAVLTLSVLSCEETDCIEKRELSQRELIARIEAIGQDSRLCADSEAGDPKWVEPQLLFRGALPGPPKKTA
jgi:hypothetical protein